MSPGWLPSPEQIAEVRKATDAFLAAKDAGRAAEADTRLLADINRSHQPFAPFAAEISKFNSTAGSVLERRIVTVTWTKDPAQADAPGVYAALDLVSRFANVDRHCGFLILYQPPSGGGFRVMREEDNFIDNATAAGIVRQHSQAELDAAWAQLTSRCPNYPAPPLPEQSASTVGYPTVAAALEGLHANPAVQFRTQAGWTVADDPVHSTIWTFAPRGDPAYPAVVKRRIFSAADGSRLEMNVLCSPPSRLVTIWFGSLNS